MALPPFGSPPAPVKSLVAGTNVTLSPTNGKGTVTINAAAGGSSPLTTKGDLFGHSTLDARLPVGADGFPLIADSNQSLGVGYATTTINANNQIGLNWAGVLVGSSTWPSSSGSVASMLTPQRLTLNGTYSPNLGATTFYSPFLVNDQITPSSSGSAYEVAMTSIRGTITFSDGVTGSTATATDVGMEVHGTNHLNSVFGWGMGIVVGTTLVDSYWGVSSALVVNNGTTITTATMFRGTAVNSGTITTCVGLDLKTLAGTTIWGIQVGAYNNYFAGNNSFGQTATPGYPVDALGTISAANTSTSAPGYRSALTGTPAASTILAGYSDTTAMPLGSNAGGIYSSFYAAPSITGTASATYVGALVNPTANGAVTKAVGAAIGSVAGSGAFATMVGLDIGVSYPLAGTTAWGLQVGAYQSYHQGSLVLGATTFPTLTAAASGGLSPKPALVTNGTYSVSPTSSGHSYYATLVNDNITISTGSANTVYGGFGITTLFTASDGRTDETAYGINSIPKFAGSNTYSSVAALNFTATVTASATTAYGMSGNLVVNGGTVTTGVCISAGAAKISGTLTTLIGLQLTSLAGGATTWGIQVGNYQNYFQGTSTFGATGTPSNTIDIQGGLINYNAFTTNYTSGGTTSITVTSGNYTQITTATGNSTVNTSAVAKAGSVLVVEIINDASAGRTITWGGNFKTAAATFAGTASKTFVYTFMSNGVKYVEMCHAGPE